VAKVIYQDEWFSWSLSQIAREFGLARDTVGRRLNDAGVISSGKKRGHPVYRVSEAAEAILRPKRFIGDSISDPKDMTPKERSDWFKSENDRLKYERDSGLSVGSDDARTQMAEVAKMGLQVLETLPDILERDFNLDAKIIAEVESKIDSLRDQWAEYLESDNENG